MTERVKKGLFCWCVGVIKKSRANFDPSRLLRVLKSTPLIHVRRWYTKGFCCPPLQKIF